MQPTNGRSVRRGPAPGWQLSLCLLLATFSSPGERFALEDLTKIVRVSNPRVAPDGKSTNRYDNELVRVQIPSGSQRILTRDRTAVFDPKWSPSSDRLAFVAPAAGKPQLYILLMDGGEAFQLTKLPAGVSAFFWKPDGKALAVIHSPDPPKTEGDDRHNRSFEAQNNHYLGIAAPVSVALSIVPSDGGGSRRLTPTAGDLAPSRPSWSPEGVSLAIERRTSREGSPVFSPAGNLVASSYPRPGSPVPFAEAWLSSLKGMPPRSRSRGIDRSVSPPVWMPDSKSILAHIAALKLSRREPIERDGPERSKLDGEITHPPGYSPGRKYPLGLSYRGSDNRGHEFEAAIASKASAGPGRDIMSGVGYLIQKGIVDESRMKVSGWSYGGRLAAWLLGNYPGRWKAGVAGAAVTDILDQYNWNDTYVRPRALFDGSPWTSLERKARIVSQSPITYASQVKAPTLILSNTGAVPVHSRDVTRQ